MKNTVIPCASDAHVYINGIEIGGVTQLSVKETSEAKFCYEMLSDEPWHAMPKKTTYTITIRMLAESGVDPGEGFTLTVSAGNACATYLGCSVKGSQLAAEPDGTPVYELTVVSASREEQNE